MKQIFKLSALLMALCFTFVSCQKDYDTTPDVVNPATNNPFKGTFTCKIDGETFTAEQQSATISESGGIKTLSIYGIKYGYQRDTKNYKSVSITIPNYTGNKKYPTGTGGVQITYVSMDWGIATTFTTNTTNANYHVTTTGDYVGTFNTTVAEVGNTPNKIVLSEGKFDIQ